MLEVKTKDPDRIPQDIFFIKEMIVRPTRNPELTKAALTTLFATQAIQNWS